MSAYVFAPPEVPSVAIAGQAERYAINRIFCVGRNYAAHAREMGFEVDREAPWYFSKSPASFAPGVGEIAYPPGTDTYHHEMELVVALGAPVFRAQREAAASAIYAYGCGLDMTRRDLQIAYREKQRPWDLGKDVEQSAVIGTLTPAGDFGAPAGQRIHLSVNGQTRQDATLADMVWKVDEIIAHLSGFYHLDCGDVILTGTPEGVGPVKPGDVLEGGIDGLEPISVKIGDIAT